MNKLPTRSAGKSTLDLSKPVQRTKLRAARGKRAFVKVKAAPPQPNDFWRKTWRWIRSIGTAAMSLFAPLPQSELPRSRPEPEPVATIRQYEPFDPETNWLNTSDDISGEGSLLTFDGVDNNKRLEDTLKSRAGAQALDSERRKDAEREGQEQGPAADED